jgi:uncharacterized protein YndB with AHSA1/START domain
MTWVWWIAGTLAATVGVIALVGNFLPVPHEASRSAEFPRPPEDVFALVSDVDGYAQWWPDGTVKVAVVERVPPSRFVTRIVGETAFGGTWTWEIEKTATGSRATITERGEIYNPIFRTLARFVFGYTSTMESCLEAARARLGA